LGERAHLRNPPKKWYVFAVCWQTPYLLYFFHHHETYIFKLC
jgi:hypothetical protein